MFLGVLVLKRVAFRKLPETSYRVFLVFCMNPLPPKNPFQDAVRQRRPIFWSSGKRASPNIRGWNFQFNIVPGDSK